MKSALSLFILALPVVCSAELPLASSNTAQAESSASTLTLISPRTGIRYSLGNVGSRQVILETAPVRAVNYQTVQRIVASNPALSATSQEKAKQVLLSASAMDPNQ